jgi:two-component system, NarL family, response regulator NreC
MYPTAFRVRERNIMSTTILIAEDHQIVREGLRRLLDGQDGMRVVGEAGDGRAAVRMAKDLHPDVVVMDIGMPDLNGIEATRQLQKAVPGVRVVALSMYSDRHNANEMMHAGARAYLLKDGAFEELADAIRKVINGQVYISPRVADLLENGHVDDEGVNGDGMARLSPREREVLALMAGGRATKEIAMDLHVSVKTVETHRRQIMEKLDLFTVAELTKFAIRHGLSPLEV